MVVIRGTFLTYLGQYTQTISLVDMGGGGGGVYWKQDNGKVVKAKYSRYCEYQEFLET